MLATLCLFTCALLPAQLGGPGGRSECLLTPRLGRGQELVYGGTFTEEVLGAQVQCKTSYGMETTVFILDTPGREMKAAFLTVLETRALRPERASEAASQASSVRLELARVDLQGHVTGADGTNLLVPLDGPPTVECGAFVTVPLTGIGPDTVWDEVGEHGRPPRSWRVAGTEAINNTRCLKLVGEQHSEDWVRPRGDRSAWQRTDTAWMAPTLGIAYRVERVIERREPAREGPTQRSVIRYDLLNHMTYSGPFYEDRRREILQARRFVDEAAPFLHNPTPYDAQLAALFKKVSYHLENQLPVEPYHKAIVQMKRRLESARRGQASPEPVPDDPETGTARAALGQQAPDFVATDLIHQGSVRLHRLRGRPILLVFFKPATLTAHDVLLFARDRQRLGVAVLGMAVSDDVAAVRKEYNERRLNFPVLSGKGFNTTYGVDATPRFVLLDADLVVRGTYTGWGDETAQEINREIKRWQKAGASRPWAVGSGPKPNQ